MKRKLILVVAGVVAVVIGGIAQDAPPCLVVVGPGESIQAALAAAPDDAVICLGEGEWNEDLVILRSVTLRGAGYDKTVIRGTADGPIVVDVRPAVRVGTHVEIVGIGIVGGVDPCPGAPEQDYLREIGDGTCRTGLRVRGRASVRVLNCRFSGHRRGVIAWDEAQVEIRDSLIEGNALVGLSVLDDAVVTLDDCTITSNWMLGVEVSGWSQVALTGCVISRNGSMGINVSERAEATLDRCEVYENGATGLFLNDRCVATLRDCSIRSNGLFGLGVDSSSRVSLSGCEVSGHLVGVLLSGNSMLALSSSRIIGNRVYGIALDEVEACAFGFGGPKFAGLVLGSDNVIPGPDHPEGNGVAGLCPRYPGDPWPAGFLAPER